MLDFSTFLQIGKLGFDFIQGQRANARAEEALAQQSALTQAQIDLARRIFERDTALTAEQLGMMRQAFERDLRVKDIGIENLLRNTRIADANYQRQVEERARLLTMIEAMNEALGQTYASLGDFERWDPSAVAEEAARRRAIYQSDVDRALERVGSKREAELIRRGMDSSTLAVQRDRELMDAAARAYQDADLRADMDALAYVSGLNRERMAMDQAELARRAGILDERQRFELGRINPLLALRLPDEMPADAPVSGLPANAFIPPSGFGAATQLLSGAGGNLSGIANLYANAATGYGQSFGESFDAFLKNQGPALNDLFKDTFRSRTPGYNPGGGYNYVGSADYWS